MHDNMEFTCLIIIIKKQKMFMMLIIYASVLNKLHVLKRVQSALSVIKKVKVC